MSIILFTYLCDYQYCKMNVTYQGKYEKKDANSLVIVLVIIWHPRSTMIVGRIVDDLKEKYHDITSFLDHDEKLWISDYYEN